MEQTAAPVPPTESPVLAILKRLRTRFSQGEIARRTGISQPTLSRWEADGVSDGADYALRLVKLEEQVRAEEAQQAGQAEGG